MLVKLLFFHLLNTKDSNASFPSTFRVHSIFLFFFFSILCNLLQRAERPLKYVHFSSAWDHHCLTKESFHSKLQGTRRFPKSYWLEVVQLRNGRGAMNGDRGISFLCSPAGSSTACCMVFLKGRFKRLIKKTTRFSLCSTFCDHILTLLTHNVQ